MKTVYAAALSRLGLSQSDAAELHGFRLDSVKSMSSGRERVGAQAWDDLRRLDAEIAARLEQLKAAYFEAAGKVGGAPDQIDLGLDDADLAGRMAAAAFALWVPQGVAVRDDLTEAVKAARAARKTGGK